jgi:hypothetical protein
MVFSRLYKLGTALITGGNCRSSLSSKFSIYKSLLTRQVGEKYVHTCSALCKSDDRKTLIASMPGKDEGTEGEKAFTMDSFIKRYYYHKLFSFQI